MTRHTGAHVFVDETKSRDYIVAAAAAVPGDVAAARKLLRGLLLPGAERLHFTHEQPARRRQILTVMSTLDVRVTLYVAQTRDHQAGRTACLEALLDHAITDRATRLILELDDSVAAADRRTIARRFRGEPTAPAYHHLRAKEEPLLWISDAVAWCAQRGGEWRESCAALVVDEHKL